MFRPIRLHADRQLIGEVADRQLWLASEPQVGKLLWLDARVQQADEVVVLVPFRAEPGECAVRQHRVEQH